MLVASVAFAVGFCSLWLSWLVFRLRKELPSNTGHKEGTMRQLYGYTLILSFQAPEGAT